uniref:Uncharacterized protein n=1 Tax=Anguilla anguilla TaxID=7936 RepID=A0A0E9UWZ8_ANGAN
MRSQHSSASSVPSTLSLHCSAHSERAHEYRIN